MKAVLVGDCMLGRLVNASLRTHPPEHPWGDTLPLFATADLRIANLECALADVGPRWSLTPKTFHFRSDRSNVAVLRSAGITAVSLANNHTVDYGFQGLAQTLETLDEAGIRHAGAGMDGAAARSPAVFPVEGVTVGLLAASDNEPAWEATDQRGGIHFVPMNVRDPRMGRLLAGVERLRARVDLLIVALHWGSNWGERPERSHAEVAHALVERGADLVYGHSCHIFRGVEVFRGAPILYSTADFVDDYAVDPIARNDQSFLFALDLDANRIARLRLYPTVIREFQARRATGQEAAGIAEKMRRLCEELGTPARWLSEDGYLEITPV